MNCEKSCDAKNMDKQCPTSTGQSSQVCEYSKTFCVQKIPERGLLEESKSDYMCNTCNKSFAKEQYLKKHIKLHFANKPHSFQISSKSFTLEGLETHLWTHREEKLHVCNICNKSCTRKSNLKEHLLTLSGEKRHICKICMKSFTHRRTLKDNLLLHTGEKTHVCNICNKSFTLKEHLKDHLLTHSREKPHGCNICSMTFGKKSNLKRHVLIHSRKKDMQNSSIDRGEELSSTSEKSKNVNSDSPLAETWKNSQENNHPLKFQVNEEIDYIVKEEHDIGDEEYSYPNVGEMLIKSENICDEMNDIVKEEHDIDYEEVVN